MDLSAHSLTPVLLITGIRSLVGTRWIAPRVPFSALPPYCYVPTLAQELFQGEPAITQLDWNFTANHNSSPSVARLVGSDLPLTYRQSSAWSWLAHPVSGRVCATYK